MLCPIAANSGITLQAAEEGDRHVLVYRLTVVMLMLAGGPWVDCSVGQNGITMVLHSTIHLDVVGSSHPQEQGLH